jgi:hypothetical protein
MLSHGFNPVALNRKKTKKENMKTSNKNQIVGLGNVSTSTLGSGYIGYEGGRPEHRGY